MSRAGRRSLGACAGLIAGLVLLGPRPAHPTLLDFEYEGAMKHAGRLRMLGQRLSKQNVLYQLHLADQHKLQLMETARQVDADLALLRAGDAAIGVPRPPTAELQKQVEAVEEAWLPLSQLVEASPYEYLRRSRQFMGPRDDRGDPLRILQFDRMAGQFVAEVDRLVELYRVSCHKDEWVNCDELAFFGVPEMLAERLLKEMVMLFAGVNAVSADRVKATRDAFDAFLVTVVEIDAVKRATVPERGPTGDHVRAILRELEDSWRRLVREAELVMRGHAEEANLRRALAMQQIVVDDFQRLRVAIEQAVGAGVQ